MVRNEDLVTEDAVWEMLHKRPLDKNITIVSYRIAFATILHFPI